MKRGQASFEYIMIAAIALLMILPATFLFFSYSARSSAELSKNMINKAGIDTLTGVEKVYYFGQNTWSSIKINLPDNVKTFYVLNHSEIVIEYETTGGRSEAVFFTDITLNTTFYYAPTSKGNVSTKPHTGLVNLKITSMGDYVLLNETI